MLGGRRGLSPSMIGRSEALARLRSLVTEPPAERADGPRVALVSGEAGVGKTRLLRELLADLPGDVITLAAQAEPGGLGRPGQLAHDLLGPADRPTGTDRPAPSPDPNGEAAGAAPEGPARTGRPALDGILTRVGRGRALVVCEDLHWADAESVDTFEHLALQPLPRLVLVATYRTDDLERGLPAEGVLRRVVRRHDVLHQRLERLSRTEVAAFLAAVYGRPLPSTVLDALYSRTGGNPFFLEELLGCCDCAPEELADQPLPWTLGEVVSRQLDGLSDAERGVVDAAAILGPRTRFDTLAAVTAVGEDELGDRLRALVGRGLLVEDGIDRFSFRHALVADAVASRQLGRDRRRLHQAALTALRASPEADLASLARHASGAGRRDELVGLAREGAAFYLARGSSFQALRLATDGLAEEPGALDLRAVATQAAWRLGLTDEALGHAQRWLADLEGAEMSSPADGTEAATGGREEAAAQRAAALRWVGRLQHELDRPDELWATVAELEALVGRLAPGLERAQALAHIGQLHMLRHRAEPAVGFAERAIAEAERAAEAGAPVRMQANVERASALVELPERLTEGAAALEEAADVAERAGDWVLATRALNNLLSCTPLPDLRRRELLERMRRTAERAGFDMMSHMYPRYRAELAAAEGDQAEALLRIERSVQLQRAYPAELCGALTTKALLLAEAGRLADAAGVLAEAVAQRVPPCSADRNRYAVVSLHRAARAGELEEGRRMWAELAIEECAYDLNLLPENIVLLIEAARRCGVTSDEVEDRLLTPLKAWLAALPGIDDLARGLLDADRPERAGIAVERLSRSLAAEPLGLPRYVAGSLRVVLGRQLLLLGRAADVPAIVDAACADLARWPGWRRDEAAALQRRVRGATVGRDGGAADGEAGELTGREREVAALVAEGLSNGELARRLFISPKTASVHVSNILAKLGMTSRSEVAAWAVRAGLAPLTSGGSRLPR